MKRIISIFLALLCLSVFPVTALAAGGITVSVSQTQAAVGDEVTVSGTATASTWISITGTDASKNILYFSAMLSDATGAYSQTFKAPDMDDGTLTITAGNGSMTASTAVAIYTSSTSSTGGSSSGTTTTTSTVSAYDSNAGKTAAVAITSSTNSQTSATTATVTATNVTSIIDAAKKAEAGIAAIEINVLSTGTVKTVEVNMPSASFKELSDSTDANIKINTGLGTVSLDAKAAESIGNTGSKGNLCISIARADSDTLSDEAKTAVGDRPVYDLSLTSGSTTISSFGGGKATVSIPYALVSGEDANKIVVYYISSSGELVAVPNCVYDASTGTVTFTTTHFSTYAVGYNNVSFTDVSGWYTDYVNYLAARGIINGTSTGDGKFSPDANITRAQFVTILARMSGDELTGYTSSSFSDVATTDWYFSAVQWAYKNGVAAGSDGKFNPNATITRQDIAVMLARYADKVASYTLPKTNSVVTFTDSAKISSYASDAVMAMQQAGIISGNSDGSFAPTASATRAQAAKMIAVLLQSMIKAE